MEVVDSVPDEWRAVIADSGYLAKVLDAFDEEVVLNDQGLALQMLRCICNAVAEIGSRSLPQLAVRRLMRRLDKNRDMAIPHLPRIWDAVPVDGLRYAALSCILNVCQDYGASVRSDGESRGR